MIAKKEEGRKESREDSARKEPWKSVLLPLRDNIHDFALRSRAERRERETDYQRGTRAASRESASQLSRQTSHVVVRVEQMRNVSRYRDTDHLSRERWYRGCLRPQVRGELPAREIYRLIRAFGRATRSREIAVRNGAEGIGFDSMPLFVTGIRYGRVISIQVRSRGR